MDVPAINAQKELVVVIMAGGVGTRLWPCSTLKMPKQFLRILGDRSLLQMSYDRIAALVEPARVLVVTHGDFVSLVREQLPALPTANIIGETERRDTAAAVALAALLAARRHGDPLMAVLTADHIMGPTDAFQATLLSALRGAADGTSLYTIGIAPAYPATGYGYLEQGDSLGAIDGVSHCMLRRFVEKPPRAVAETYVNSGVFLWNSGMFIWRASAILRELGRHLPEHLAALTPVVDADGTERFIPLLKDALRRVPKVSIDVGVMEKASAIRCVRATFEWSDVGSFAALAEHLPNDTAANASRGRTAILDAARNLVFCDDEDELVALVGVDDLIVVRAGRRTLVVPKGRAEDVKRLVAALAAEEQ